MEVVLVRPPDPEPKGGWLKDVYVETKNVTKLNGI